VAAKGVKDREEAEGEGFDFPSDGMEEREVEGMKRNGCSVVESGGREPC